VSSPKKIHVATKAYLKAWAPSGCLKPVDVRYGPQKSTSPAGVAWRREWWGADDASLNAACEDACAKLEQHLPGLLHHLESRWPPKSSDRALLSQFLALHIARTPAFAAWFAKVRDASLARYADQLSEPQYKLFREQMQSDKERARKIFRMLNKLGSLLGSMSWTLLRFDEPLLITSDQPVCPAPFVNEGEIRGVAAIPGDGWTETVEVRCALTPRLALLGSWDIRPEVAPMPGSWADAVNLNVATRGQADRQWFRVTDRAPALPPVIERDPLDYLEPLTPQLLPGYSTRVARRSQLRHRARLEIERLVKAQDDQTLTLITVEERAA
jgi:hypothetical protein